VPVATKSRRGLSREATERVLQKWFSSRVQHVAQKHDAGRGDVAKRAYSDFDAPRWKPSECERDSECAQNLGRGVVAHVDVIREKLREVATSRGDVEQIHGAKVRRIGYLLRARAIEHLGEKKFAILARTEDDNIFGAHYVENYNGNRVSDVFFSAHCDNECIEKVRSLVACEGECVEKANRSFSGWYVYEYFYPGNDFYEFDFGDVKLYVLKNMYKVFIDAVHNGKHLGGALAFAISVDDTDILKSLRPLAEKLAERLGRERARQVVETALSYVEPDWRDAIGKILDKAFSTKSAATVGVDLSFPPPIKKTRSLEYVDSRGESGTVNFEEFAEVTYITPSRAHAKIPAMCKVFTFSDSPWEDEVGALCTLNTVSLGRPKGNVVWSHGDFYMTDEPLHLSFVFTGGSSKQPKVKCFGVGDACVSRIKERFDRAKNVVVSIAPAVFKVIAKKNFKVYKHNVGHDDLIYVVPDGGKHVAFVVPGDWDMYYGRSWPLAKELYDNFVRELSADCRDSRCVEEKRRLAKEVFKSLLNEQVFYMPRSKHKDFLAYLEGGQ